MRPWPAGAGVTLRTAMGGAVPQLLFVAVCAVYAVGAGLGWGSPRLALVMGDFGLSLAALLASASCLWYARTRAGMFRPAWTLFGLSSLMVGLGNGVWGWYEVVLRQPVPRTSAADVCFLLFAPLAVIGLLLLAKRPVSRVSWICLALDAWLVGGSLLTLSWSLALTHLAHWQGETIMRAALALAYPLLDIALVTVVLVLHLKRGAVRCSAINAALGAFALTVLCDALFISPMLREQYNSGQLLDAGWFAGSLLLACAPWVSGRRNAEPSATTSSRPLAGSLALTPYLAAAVCTLSILITVVNGSEVDHVVVFTACAVVLALLVRQGITLLDNVRLTQQLVQKESHFRSLVQGSSDVIMIAGPDGVLHYVSPAAAGVYGLAAESLVGERLSELIHPDDLSRVLHELRRFLSVPPAAEQATRIECRVRHGAGGWLHVESSVNRHQSGLIFNSRDVTERVRLQEQLQHNASHDPLTDLPNRALFTERIRLAIGGRRAGETETAVFYIDLDGFKAVNDTVGHQVGDELLIRAARRLKASVRSGDTTARLGGDEFAALIISEPVGEGSPREARILEVADRVRAALSKPYWIDGSEIRVAASIGIAFAEQGITPAALLRNADLAMYRAKQAGKARAELFVPQLRDEVARRAELAAKLRKAVRADEFTLLHQPMARLADGLITGLTAQARWCAAPNPVVTPGEYPQVELPPGGPVRPTAGTSAADAGRGAVADAAEVNRWLIEEAIAEGGRRLRGGRQIPVSVRIPASRLADRSLGAGSVEALLARHGLPPEALTLTLAGAQECLAAEQFRQRLTDLRTLGVGVGLHAFGGEAAPLTVLHQLPITQVRLARELVHGVLDSPRLRTIVAGLLRMADDLEIDSVADGVDLPEQLVALRELGCTQGEGVALGEPLDAARLPGLLEHGRVTVPPAGGRPAGSRRAVILAPRVGGSP